VEARKILYHISVQVRSWGEEIDAYEALRVFELNASPGVPVLHSPTGVASQTASVHLITPEFVVLVGAAIGGLFAFLIRSQRTNVEVQAQISSAGISRRTSIWRLVHSVSGATGAVLLSVITTILLNRISESQFLIRVTIADFWGAIAVGFMVTFAGASYLARILGQSSRIETTAASVNTRVPASDPEEKPAG
jgi:hypothetical protein